MLSLDKGQRVDLTSHYNTERKVENFVLVDYDIPQSCVATYFPEANALVPLSLKARKSNTPASKGVVVKIKARDARL
jgi:hypothetical protein